MSELYGTIINGTIYPASTEETFATHDALYGKGGYRSVNTIQERDAIPLERLTLGCEVRVMGEEGSPVYYVSSMSPLTWKKLNYEGGTGEGLSREDVEEIINDQKGKPNGLASLNDLGKVPSDQLDLTGVSIDEGRVTEIIEELKGSPNGIPSLDESGKIPESQLPEIAQQTQVVFRGYYVNPTTFNDESSSPYLNPNKSSVYVDIPTNSLYTYDGTNYQKEVMYWNEV
jgi:hypothetical protein